MATVFLVELHGLCQNNLTSLLEVVAECLPQLVPLLSTNSLLCSGPLYLLALGLCLCLADFAGHLFALCGEKSLEVAIVSAT